jgi:hypothetical protein
MDTYILVYRKRASKSTIDSNKRSGIPRGVRVDDVIEEKKKKRKKN